MDRSATKLNATINTPCVGICSTVYGDEICRGCKRFYKEIIEWNAFADNTKHEIFQRLSQLMSTTVCQFLIITDPALLQQQLEKLQIRYHPTDDAFCWAHHLLRFLQDKPQSLSPYGVITKPEFAENSLRELFTLIDEALYAVAGDFYRQCEERV
jgi:predicted Fe-S protein YdhL (DUF1289 family)